MPQLGVEEPGGNPINSTMQPTRVRGLEENIIAGVAAGSEFAACWTTAGDVFTWGNAERGQVGHEDPGDTVLEPTKVGLSQKWPILCLSSSSALVP